MSKLKNVRYTYLDMALYLGRYGVIPMPEDVFHLSTRSKVSVYLGRSRRSLVELCCWKVSISGLRPPTYKLNMNWKSIWEDEASFKVITVVVARSACSPYTLTIRFRIPLTPIVFSVKFVFEKNKNKQKRDRVRPMKTMNEWISSPHKYTYLMYFQTWHLT